MLKVFQKDLLFLTPSKGTEETFPIKIEAFLSSKGYFIPVIPQEQASKIRECTLSYWKENKHENLVEAAWLYGYCSILNIDLDLTFKR